MPLGRWLWEERASCFAGITMLLSYTIWSVAAKLWGGDFLEWMEDVLVRMPGNENKRDVLRGLLRGKWGKEDQVKSIFANLPNFD